MPLARHLVVLVACASLAAAATAPPAGASGRARLQKTVQITHGNGPSTHAVISADRRWARAIAFESDASNLVRGDSNGRRDVFVVRQGGHFDNRGQMWKPGKIRRVSRSRRGGAANGASYSPAISGGFDAAPRCVAFLSDASNLVAGDRNGVTDAFVSSISRGTPKRVSLPGRRESAQATTQVGRLGNRDSRNPMIGNSGKYVTFETDATNLGVNATGRTGDDNGRPDTYLYTDNRKLTLVQSVKEKAVPLNGGGRNPSMSFYANYLLFDSPAPMNAAEGRHQIFMRYLGPA